jgi:hypothetical protein
MRALALIVLLGCRTDKTSTASEALLLETHQVVMCTGRQGTARCVADGRMFHCIVANHEDPLREAMCEPEPPPQPPIIPKVPVLPNTPEKP